MKIPKTEKVAGHIYKIEYNKDLDNEESYRCYYCRKFFCEGEARIKVHIGDHYIYYCPKCLLKTSRVPFTHNFWRGESLKEKIVALV